MPTPQVVLIVEEHPELRDALMTALEREGYQVVAAGDELGARRSLEENDVDLLVWDTHLGSESSVSVLEAYPKMPVIAMADGGFGPRVALGPWTTVGRHRILRKPFRLGDLLAACRAAIGPPTTEPEE